MLYMIVPKSFGFAGTKDKRAITTQRVQSIFFEKEHPFFYRIKVPEPSSCICY